MTPQEKIAATLSSMADLKRTRFFEIVELVNHLGNEDMITEATYRSLITALSPDTEAEALLRLMQDTQKHIKSLRKDK